MIALLREGKLSVDRAGGGAEEYQVVGGVLKVEKNQVTILPEKYSGSIQRQSATPWPDEPVLEQRDADAA